MKKRVQHASQLIHQSMRVVKQQKKLLLLPLISSVVILLMLTLVITPITHYEKMQLMLHKNQPHIIILAYVIGLLFIFVVHQIALQFSAALTHCINQYFKGNRTLLMGGIKAANAHFIQLYNWNSYAATIGILIHLFYPLLQNLPFYKRLLQGLRWTIATYLVIPVIMANKTGPVKSIKRSAELIGNTWGKNLKTNFRFIPFLLFLRFLMLIPLIVGLLKGGHQNIIIGGILTVTLVIIVTTISSITQTILTCALHLYASEGIIAPGFDETALKSAFIERTD